MKVVRMSLLLKNDTMVCADAQWGQEYREHRQGQGVETRARDNDNDDENDDDHHLNCSYVSSERGGDSLNPYLRNVDYPNFDGLSNNFSLSAVHAIYGNDHGVV